MSIGFIDYPILYNVRYLFVNQMFHSRLVKAAPKLQMPVAVKCTESP
jgi:hypothetical protein